MTLKQRNRLACRKYAATPKGKRAKLASQRRNARKAGQYVAKNHAKYPGKYRARYTLNNAIRYGKVKRQACEVCGRRAQAHHMDYRKPLSVKWLCSKHHSQLHRKVG